MEPFRSSSSINGIPTVLSQEQGASAPTPGELLPVDRIVPGYGDPLKVAEPPPGLSEMPDLDGLLRALRRRWLFALLGGLLCSSLSAAAVYLYLPPPKYTARALVHVAEKRPRELFETRESEVGFRTYQETQVILVKSRKVLEAALNPPAIASLPTVRKLLDPIDWLSGVLMVDFPRGSEILSISMTASCPPLDLSALVNAIADSYLTEIVDKERLARVERLERLKELFADYQKDLTEKRLKFKEMAGSIGTSDKQAAAVRQQMMVEHLGLARQELLKLKSDVRKSQARLNVLASKPELEPTSNQTVPALETLSTAEVDPQVMELRSRLAELRRKYASVKRISRQGNVDPSILAIQREIKLVVGELEGRRQELRAAAAELNHDRADPVAIPDARLEEVKEYLEILHEQEKSLIDEIASLESQMSSLNVKSMDFHWLEDEITVASDTAKMVGVEVQSMTVEMQAPPRIRLIEKASVPTMSDPFRRYKLSAIVGAGVFLAFVGCVSLWEFQSRRIDVPDEVAFRLGLRIIGDLPKLNSPRRDDRKQIERDRLVQSIDAVRTMLLNAGRHQPFRVVMITSALKGEGKTSLSCHLATSLARGGRKTLLIDCDLRKPSLHDIFDFPSGPGLGDILRGEIGWTDAVRQTLVPDLSLILAGRCDPATIDLLPREDFPNLLKELRDQFDFIIVDTSPLLLVTDALIVSQHVDAVLFSVLRAVSQLPQVYAASERLASMGVRILGAVVSGVPLKPNRYYGSYTSPQWNPVEEESS
ncbi:MAG: polysaccharide biosynthesis tyrosine autokinase [Paludisphaera borealis]|uniref:GumC family protein n=1 Tax=Paludisphaera borealis TaxID=1387353 RepID=UPI00283B3572|nr:polysaccharide biosynthesis tyrosine autokinase [Paludisphaera borealis]MDR3623142.1 polysaccharide biosynthesis tyrosine autokinase [Paludisphaera borealis]